MKKTIENGRGILEKYRKNVLTACFWKRTEMFMKEKLRN